MVAFSLTYSIADPCEATAPELAADSAKFPSAWNARSAPGPVAQACTFNFLR